VLILAFLNFRDFQPTNQPTPFPAVQGPPRRPFEIALGKKKQTLISECMNLFFVNYRFMWIKFRKY
jgi:hypothetical protein